MIDDDERTVTITATIRLDEGNELSGASLEIAPVTEEFDPVTALLFITEGLLLIELDRELERTAPPMTGDIRANLAAAIARVSLLQAVADMPLHTDMRRGRFTMPA